MSSRVVESCMQGSRTFVFFHVSLQFNFFSQPTKLCRPASLHEDYSSSQGYPWDLCVKKMFTDSLGFLIVYI